MRDESIINNTITFLIAVTLSLLSALLKIIKLTVCVGHEKTVQLLSFTIYFLLTHHRAYRKAQEEVEQITGQKVIQFKHISELRYVQACLCSKGCKYVQERIFVEK